MTCRRHRRRGSSPAAQDSPLENDDLLWEILIRLPPEPSSLPRASAVCKHWRCIVGDTKFHRQFCAHHRKPPLVGAFVFNNHSIVFNPLLDPPNRIPPPRFELGRYSRKNGYGLLLDCRHGRILVKDPVKKAVVVCDPITGDQRWVPFPWEFECGSFNGALLCAAVNHGHVHGCCHWSPFKVVLVSMYGNNNRGIIACVYSSETGLWANLIATDVTGDMSSKPAVLVGNCFYWLSLSNAIFQFDLDENSLTVMWNPPIANNVRYENRQIIRAEHGALGYAILSYPHFQMWQRNFSGHGVAIWVPWKTLEMHTVLGLPSQIEARWDRLIGYGEETDVVFLLVGYGFYMVQLKSMQSKKLYETKSIPRCHPFASFYTPGSAIHGKYNGPEMLHDT